MGMLGRLLGQSYQGAGHGHVGCRILHFGGLTNEPRVVSFVKSQSLWVLEIQIIMLWQSWFLVPLAGPQNGNHSRTRRAQRLALGHPNDLASRHCDKVTLGRMAKGKGRGKRPQVTEVKTEPSTSNKRRGRKPMANMISEATAAYKEGTKEEIRRLIAEWEEDINQQASVDEAELEDWKLLVPDLGNTSGRGTQFKQTLHLYWLMKCLLSKAMEQIWMTAIQDFQDYKQEFQKL